MNKFTKVLLATLFIATASSSLSALPGSFRDSNDPCAHGFDVTPLFSLDGLKLVACVGGNAALAWVCFNIGCMKTGAVCTLAALFVVSSRFIV